MKTFNSIDIINRIKQALEIKTDSKLADYLGISKSTLSNWISRNSIDYDLMFSKCERINYNWLLTGEGEMLKYSGNEYREKSPVVKLPLAIDTDEETRPRIPLNVAAGALSVCQDGVTLSQCEQLPVIRAFSRYDFTILVHGESMEPELHSGDELACLYVNNSSFIQWGRPHILDTPQGIVVKRIFDGGDTIICESDNERFHRYSIPKQEVYNIALVIGLIRRY